MTDVQQRPAPWPPPDPRPAAADPSAAAEAIAQGQLRSAWPSSLAVAAFVGIRWGWWAIVVVLGFVAHDLPARARPLPHGQPGRHEGHRVLPRLRPPHLVVPPGRDRVRRQGHPAGAYVRIIGMNNLEEVDRRPTRPAPTAPRAYWRRCRVAVAGVGHALRAGPRAAVRRPRRLRRAPCATPWIGRPASATDSPAAARRARSSATASSRVDGQPVATFDELTAIIRAKPGEEVDPRRRAGRRAAHQGRHPGRAPARPASGVGFLGIGPALRRRAGRRAERRAGRASTEFGRIAAGSVDRPRPDLQPRGLRATTSTCSPSERPDGRRRTSGSCRPSAP